MVKAASVKAVAKANFFNNTINPPVFPSAPVDPDLFAFKSNHNGFAALVFPCTVKFPEQPRDSRYRRAVRNSFSHFLHANWPFSPEDALAQAPRS
jgi:hypothetical protein